MSGKHEGLVMEYTVSFGHTGNAKQAAYYYKTAFGFRELAYAGLETGLRDRVSYVLVQDKIRLVLTSPFNPDSEISHHIRLHGDGVKVIALLVDDAKKALTEIAFFKTRNDEHVMRSLRTLVYRAGPDGRELDLLRAMAITLKRCALSGSSPRGL